MHHVSLGPSPTVYYRNITQDQELSGNKTMSKQTNLSSKYLQKVPERTELHNN
ncbi:hypothetical protein I79_008417 [Cricetulus griseus]|uniref:Uncharacterized protein n=1 Tax=Cricetulus griseus TaxID=10029 RepID=G3HD43_CRIGR|nr:hypothetical protein I79_008417 [Cricetulus griseus]